MAKRNLLDPRTVARDIPGLFDAVFPGLAPGVVAHCNALSTRTPSGQVSNRLLQAAVLAPAMLFEMAAVRADWLLLASDRTDDRDACKEIAWKRQSKFYDANKPAVITDEDWAAVECVSVSLYRALCVIGEERGAHVTNSPRVPGCQWIESSVGDYAAGDCLVEVKCISGNFGAADYRQILIYWMLSYVASLEAGGVVWRTAVLLNPRKGLQVQIDFPEFLTIVGRGASHVELAQRFLAILGERLRG